MRTIKTYDQKHSFGRHHEKSTLKSVLFGVVILAVGGILAANKLGYIPENIFNILISWQSLLITIGIISLTTKKSILPGIILIIIGGGFMLPDILNLNVNVKHLVTPAILMVIGISIIFHSILKPKHKEFGGFKFEGTEELSDDYLNEKYVFGGTNLHVKSQNFKGGKLEAIFGGGKIDLSEAVLSQEGKNILDLNLVFGGFEIIVPRDWNVVVKTTSVLGGVNVKNGISAENIDFSKELIITGNMVFGGAEIKRY